MYCFCLLVFSSQLRHQLPHLQQSTPVHLSQQRLRHLLRYQHQSSFLHHEKSLMKNTFGFVKNIIKRLLFSRFRAKDLTKIYNYHKVPGLFETSGQPGKQQLKLLAKTGYELVINLAPSSRLEGAVINEAQILEAEKVEYIHIPVDFNNPSNEDFEKFVSNIERHKGKKIWVHCAANMRVSAFIYKYRRDVLQLPHQEIIGDMEAIWTPNKTWSTFLSSGKQI